jgi:hypothetical protein
MRTDVCEGQHHLKLLYRFTPPPKAVFMISVNGHKGVSYVFKHRLCDISTDICSHLRKCGYSSHLAILHTCILYKILGYSATRFFLLFAQSQVWFLGDSNVFHSSQAIYGHCCLIAWQPYDS